MIVELEKKKALKKMTNDVSKRSQSKGNVATRKLKSSQRCREFPHSTHAGCHDKEAWDVATMPRIPQ
ncbi:hypothetical protein J1N35_025730 [Gossypium stocksii]|uniref:Uncharacterized protein n=1 Tax=Gossypium stocksii TaxID=47602 RepID=A0A9D3V711_9ROSI|nr:hypothetical protein J1N35_025730 [Gossypium stocksii]